MTNDRTKFVRAAVARCCALLFFAVLLLSGCTPAAAEPAPFATFTPLGGFRILGNETPLPQSPTPTNTQLPTGTAPPAATATNPPVAAPTELPTPTSGPPPRITMVFTGQIVPGRCVQAEVERLGQADYIYEDVADILKSVDLTVGTLNGAIVDFGLTTGCLETFLFVGRSVHAEAMANAGFDVMSVATNHIKDCYLNNCEDQAFIATLDNLKKNNIYPVGGGPTPTEAEAPVYIDISGITFAFVSLGQLPPPSFTDQLGPGIGLLDEETLRRVITEADSQADFVIFLPHWGPESSHYPSAAQVRLAKVAVDSGADLIVGNHTQYIQAFVDIENVPVYFGLGNFVFDQISEPERTQSLILRITFEGAEIVSRELIPAVNNATGQVRVANQQEFVQILTEIQNISSIVQLEIP